MNDPETAASVEAVYAAFVAIDWASQKHTYALQPAASKSRERGQIEATPEAVQAWVAELMGRFPGQPIAVALEQKRGALFYCLSKYAALVLYPIHPATVSRMREALHPSSNKTDPQDADLQLDLLLHHRDRLQPFRADTVETRRLQVLVEDRRKWVDELTGFTQQLREKLLLYYPQAVALLPELQSPMAADFLKRWPTLEELKKARPATLEQFFHRHNSRSQELLTQRLERIAQAVPATQDAAVVDTSVLAVQSLLQVMATVRQQIAVFERQIEQTAAAHPEYALMQSFPGAGPALAPRLVAALGTQRERFASAAQLQAASGIAPVQKSSGQSQWIHFRWACPKFLRQSFHEFALHSIGFSRWAKAYYDQQRRHKGHPAAVRALAFKWQRILFRCWKSRTPYDEQRYLAALRQRGSPLAAALE